MVGVSKDNIMLREAVAELINERPVRTGSLLVTIFGDAIAPRGGAVTLSSLIKLIAPLGPNERLVRTTIGRQAKENWLVCERRGKFSQYSLSSNAKVLYSLNAKRIYNSDPLNWDGHWTLVPLHGLGGSSRQKARYELNSAGFGEIFPNLFAHPNYELESAKKLITPFFSKKAPIVFMAVAIDQISSHEIINLGWDIYELNGRYLDFVNKYDKIFSFLCAGSDIEEETAFALRILMINDYRNILFQDPTLPLELLPSNWCGEKAKFLCKEIYKFVFFKSEHFIDINGLSFEGRFPIISRDALDRFGGIG